MLKEKQMQEIQDLKLRGYSMNEIVRYYEEKGQKPPSLPTIRNSTFPPVIVGMYIDKFI